MAAYDTPMGMDVLRAAADYTDRRVADVAPLTQCLNEEKRSQVSFDWMRNSVNPVEIGICVDPFTGSRDRRSK
jgi:hypothetical protein